MGEQTAPPRTAERRDVYSGDPTPVTAPRSAMLRIYVDGELATWIQLPGGTHASTLIEAELIPIGPAGGEG